MTLASQDRKRILGVVDTYCFWLLLRLHFNRIFGRRNDLISL